MVLKLSPAPGFALRLVLAATALAMLPLKPGPSLLAPGFQSAAAWAKDGGGGNSGSGENSGPGGGGSDDDDDDDRSGSNSGSGGSGSNSGSGSSGSGGSGGGTDDSGKRPQISRILVRGHDITVEYGDGWTETVKAGRYVLIDPRRRVVINRAATRADVGRLFAYVP